MKKYGSLAVLLCAAALTACNYDKNAVQDITGPLPASRVMFFNFGLNAPAVNFYADNTKMTAVLSTSGAEAATGVAYGGVGAGGLYTGIAPGTHTFAGKIAATEDKDLAVSTLATSVGEGKNYSYYQSGVYDAAAKKVDAFMVEDPFPPEIDYSKAIVRFVNAIYNSSPMTLYAKDRATGVETAVGAAVAYKTAGAFTGLPNGVYDLSVRAAGSSTNLITRASVSFVQGNVYTIGARGDMTVTSSTAVNRPFLDNTVNR